MSQAPVCTSRRLCCKNRPLPPLMAILSRLFHPPVLSSRTEAQNQADSTNFYPPTDKLWNPPEQHPPDPCWWGGGQPIVRTWRQVDSAKFIPSFWENFAGSQGMREGVHPLWFPLSQNPGLFATIVQLGARLSHLTSGSSPGARG